jgi:hypothetical protein
MRGLSVKYISLSDKPKEAVISLLDLEGPSFLHGITLDSYEQLKGFLLDTTPNGLLGLTMPCQIRCTEPSYGLILGLARCLRNELGLSIATLGLDECDSPASLNVVVIVHTKLQQAMKDGDVDVDSEYKWSGGALHTPRFHWVSYPTV